MTLRCIKISESREREWALQPEKNTYYWKNWWDLSKVFGLDNIV